MTDYLSYREFIDLYENKGFSVHDIINEDFTNEVGNKIKNYINNSKLTDKNILQQDSEFFTELKNNERFYIQECGIIFATKEILYLFKYSNPFSIFKMDILNNKRYYFDDINSKFMKNKSKFEELELKEISIIYDFITGKVTPYIKSLMKDYKMENWNSLIVEKKG